MAPATSTPRPARLRELDGLRGLAILLVIVAHYYVQVPIAGAWQLNFALKHLFAYAGTGVELFFVLSGFLVGGILIDQQGADNLLRTFMARRFYRIVPLYALLLISFAVAAAVSDPTASYHRDYFNRDVSLWYYVFQVQNNAFGLLQTIGPWWIVVSWSVGVEVQFYAIAPFLLRRTSPRSIYLAAAGGLLLAPAVRIVFMDVFANLHAANYLFVCRFESLLLGVAVAAAWRNDKIRSALQRRAGALRLAALAAILTGALWPFVGDDTTWFPYALLPTLAGLAWTLVLVAVLGSSTHWTASILRFPGLAVTGDISYFLYLFHLPVLYLFHATLFGDFAVHLSGKEQLVTIGALLTAMGLGWLSFRYFESPLLRLGHRHRYSTS